MSIYGLAARGVMFAASGPPSHLSMAGAALGFVAPNQQFVKGAIGVLNVLDTLAELRKVANAVSTLAGRGSDAAAAEMVRLMRERVAVDSGDLQDSIDYTRGAYVPDHPNVRGVGASMEADDNTIVVYAGSFDAFYAGFVEFGTANMDAQPFFWDTAREVLAATRRGFETDLDSLADEFNA